MRHLNPILKARHSLHNFLVQSTESIESQSYSSVPFFFFVPRGVNRDAASDHYHLNTKCNAKATLQGTRQFSFTLHPCTNTNANHQQTRCNNRENQSRILMADTSSREIHETKGDAQQAGNGPPFVIYGRAMRVYCSESYKDFPDGD